MVTFKWGAPENQSNKSTHEKGDINEVKFEA